MKFRPKTNQSGFTLMEIVVATAIFAATVTLMLSLFAQALQINRRVQTLRQLSQGTRNFTETLAKEIRNGRINYSSVANCPAANYSQPDNKVLSITTQTADILCFYLDSQTGELKLSKESNNTQLSESINPKNFTIDPATFRFIVRPKTNPDSGNPPYNGIQPSVTVIAKFIVQIGASQPVNLPYQTTISTDYYDIPHYQ